MRLLVLGGTKFLGRAVVEASLVAAHEVTLFNCGHTNPGLFPETARDTLVWSLEASEQRPTLSPEREREILATSRAK